MTGCSTRIKDRRYSGSLLGCYLCCPHKAYCRFILGLVPKEPRLAMNFGTVWHEVLAEWYRTESESEALKKIELLGDSPSPFSQERLLVFAQKYFTLFKKESWKVKDVEVEFALDMGDGTFYTGRIDLVVEWAGGIYVVDHKTSGRMGPAFGERYNPAISITGYCFATKTLVGACNGAIINGLNTSDNPKDRFLRFQSPRLPVQLEWWRENYLLISKDLERDMAAGVWKKNYDFCGVYGCEYKNLCLYGMEERMIENEFRVEDEEARDE